MERKFYYNISINPKNNKEVTIHDSNLKDSMSQLIEQLKKRQQKENHNQNYKSIDWHLQNNIPKDKRHLSQIQTLYYNIQYRFQLVLKEYTFKDLKYVKFSLCYLRNCQFLSFMDMPMLEKLILGSNFFTNFKSLAKASLPELQYIDLEQNIAPQIKVQRVKISQKIQNIYFQQSSFTTVLGEDLSFLAKLQLKIPSSLQSIKARCKYRVKQYKYMQEMQRVLQRKFYDKATRMILN